MTEQYINFNASIIKYTSNAYFIRLDYENCKLNLWIPKQYVRNNNSETLIHCNMIERIQSLISLKEKCTSKKILIDADIESDNKKNCISNITGYQGVSPTKHPNKWRVSISGNYLGTYTNILEAAYTAKKFEKLFFNQ